MPWAILWDVAPDQIRRRERLGLRLWNVGLVLSLTFVTTIAIAAAVFFAGWDLLGAQGLKEERRLTSKTLFDLVKLSFGVVAGAGALVALVVAYRRQRADEDGALREATRLHTERFTTAVSQLGEESAAVRLGGVHALAGLADDAPTRDLRQTCIDVLCAYLRLPYAAGNALPLHDAEAQHAYLALREVRHTVIRLVRDHLRLSLDHPHSWRGHDLDFTGIVFDGGDFGGAEFSGGTVDFGGAVFSSGTVSFRGAEFSGGRVSFCGAEFSGAEVGFVQGRFSGGTVDFRAAEFSDGRVTFGGAVFSGSTVHFHHAFFSGGTVSLMAAFSGGTVDFNSATFAGSTIHGKNAAFSGGTVHFHEAQFMRGTIDFTGAVFSRGTVDFNSAVFSGAKVDFRGAEYSGAKVAFLHGGFHGGTIDFTRTVFSGDTVEFSSEFSGSTVDFSFAAGVAPSGLVPSHGEPLPTGLSLPPAWLSPAP